MKPVIITRTINATLEKVFQTVADARNYRQAVPHIVDITFLSDQQQGPGTRFRETRLIKGRTQAVELEVTEFVENKCIRLVSVAGGTTWDTLFSIATIGNAVELKMHMDIRPHGLLASAMNTLIRGMVVKGVEEDMDAVKAYCEASNSPT